MLLKCTLYHFKMSYSKIKIYLKHLCHTINFETTIDFTFNIIVLSYFMKLDWHLFEYAVLIASV